jgi:hypothetical protein
VTHATDNLLHTGDSSSPRKGTWGARPYVFYPPETGKTLGVFVSARAIAGTAVARKFQEKPDALMNG